MELGSPTKPVEAVDCSDWMAEGGREEMDGEPMVTDDWAALRVPEAEDTPLGWGPGRGRRESEAVAVMVAVAILEAADVILAEAEPAAEEAAWAALIALALATEASLARALEMLGAYVAGKTMGVMGCRVIGSVGRLLPRTE